MTETFPILIETDQHGITIRQVGTPELSIGPGNRCDMIWISRDQVPALIKLLQPIANEVFEEESL